MYINKCTKLIVPGKEQLVSLSKSFPLKYLAILYQKKIEIRSLTSSKLELIDGYYRSDISLCKYGFNHWIQWISQFHFAIGTKTGHIIFLEIKESCKIVEVIAISVSNLISAWSTAFNSLIICIPGPSLLFFSPQGVLLSNIEIQKSSLPSYESSLLINQIDISENEALFLFSDGNLSKAVLNQSNIISSEPIALTFFPVSNIAHISLSSTSNWVASTAFDETLMISNGNSIYMVAEDVSQFQWTDDSSYLISISNSNKLTIFSLKTHRKIQIPFEALNINEKEKPNSNGFIMSLYDSSTLRFFFGSSNCLYYFSMCQTSPQNPSQLFRSDEEIFIPIDKSKIKIPQSFLNKSYPLMHCCCSLDGKEVVIAGRENIASKSVSKNWEIIEDSNNFVRAIWFQEFEDFKGIHKYFVMIVYELKNPHYKLLLLNPLSLKPISVIDVSGIFKCITYKDNKIFYGSSHSACLYSIINDSFNMNDKFEPLPSFDEIQFFNDGFVIHTKEQELQFYSLQSHSRIQAHFSTEGISHCFSYKDILFFIAHNQQFVFGPQFKFVIRLNIQPSLFASGVNLYTESQDSNGYLIQPFLSNLLISFLDEPDLMFDIAKNFLIVTGILDEIIKVMKFALDNGKWVQFITFLNHIEPAKDNFLIVGLLKFDHKYSSFIKNQLSSKDVLIRKFPLLEKQINEVYSMK